MSGSSAASERQQRSMSGCCAPTVGTGRARHVRFMPEWRYRGNISVHPHRRATAHPTGREGGSVSAPGSALDGKHARQGSACRAYLSLVGSSSTREAAEVAQQHAAVGRVESDSRRMAISRKRWDPLASSGFGTAWIRYSVDVAGGRLCARRGRKQPRRCQRRRRTRCPARGPPDRAVHHRWRTASPVFGQAPPAPG